jgi:hypothetical protein
VEGGWIVTAIICTKCEDTGYITVRYYYPMSYVCAGWPPEDARGVCGARCNYCDPVIRATEEEESDG